MKLDRAGQSALLKLAQVDLEIEQIKVEISKAIGSRELSEASALLSQYSGEVIAARTKYENLNMESRKADDNLHMVEERIARDLERLNQTSSPKDAQAMQSEVESLTLRKAELEEVELEILERLEEAQTELDEISAMRESTAKNIEEIQARIQTQVDELKSRGRKLTADREILVTKIPADVLEKYKNLAAKQIAVGQVEARACSACRMGLTASTIDSLAGLAEDEIGSCPECLAMIVR
jgi:predicted  nucleic acid-binding Zn-ribbon protein